MALADGPFRQQKIEACSFLGCLLTSRKRSLEGLRQAWRLGVRPLLPFSHRAFKAERAGKSSSHACCMVKHTCGIAGFVLSLRSCPSGLTAINPRQQGLSCSSAKGKPKRRKYPICCMVLQENSKRSRHLGGLGKEEETKREEEQKRTRP